MDYCVQSKYILLCATPVAWKKKNITVTFPQFDKVASVKNFF